MKNVIRIILIIILALSTKIIVEKIIWNGTTRSERLKKAVDEAVAISTPAVPTMTKKIFNPGSFYLLVPDSEVKYETTKEQYIDYVLIHHSFTIIDDAMRMGVIINHCDYGVQVPDDYKTKLFDLIFTDQAERNVNKNHAKLLYRKKTALGADEFAFEQNLKEGKNYFVVRSQILGQKLYSIKTLSPSKTLCEQVLNSFEIK
jgi:hypothetical protein